MSGFISSPGHAITLGGLRLMQAGRPAVHAGFTLDVSKDGTTWGNPQVVVSSLISELSAGDVVTEQHIGNREPVLYVRIEADTHAGLIAGDSAISAVVGPPCELSWQNPDPLAPLTVIDVVHSRMDHAWDDWDALNRRRVWIVTMSALPWPRSVTKVLTPAVATPVAAPTVVNSGSATTGWASTNGTVTVVSGAVVSTYNGAVPLSGLSTKCGTNLTLTGTVSTNPQHYVAVDWKSSVPALHFFGVPGHDSLTEVRREPAPTATFTRSWYVVPENSIADLRLRTSHNAAPGTQTLSIDQVVKAETLPTLGTVKQIARTITPGGNVTAEGDVIVEHATAGLGQTIVYSHPTGDGYSPPLRPWLAASDAVTVDANTVSGGYNTLTGASTFVVPPTSIPPGDTQLWARLFSSSGTGTVGINWKAEAYMNATQVGEAQVGVTQVNFPATGTFYLFPLARLTLPPARVGHAGRVWITMQRDVAGTIGVIVDEAWLFAMDKGRLTVLDCGSGTPAYGTVSNRLKVAAPSLSDPFGSVMMGVAADGSDAFTPPAAKVLCDQTGHRFDPAGSAIHVVTSGPSTEASVSFEHYPRWRAEAG